MIFTKGLVTVPDVSKKPDNQNTRHLKNNEESSSANEKDFGQSPFAGLELSGLPPGPKLIEPAPKKSRGRVNIIRSTAHRGGKTVTVIKDFVGIGLPEKEKLAKAMQKACGVGGTVKEGRIEIQGDKRNEVAKILTEAGFTPVFAGG